MKGVAIPASRPYLHHRPHRDHRINLVNLFIRHRDAPIRPIRRAMRRPHPTVFLPQPMNLDGSPRPHAQPARRFAIWRASAPTRDPTHSDTKSTVPNETCCAEFSPPPNKSPPESCDPPRAPSLPSAPRPAPPCTSSAPCRHSSTSSSSPPSQSQSGPPSRPPLEPYRQPSQESK